MIRDGCENTGLGAEQPATGLDVDAATGAGGIVLPDGPQTEAEAIEAEDNELAPPLEEATPGEQTELGIADENLIPADAIEAATETEESEDNLQDSEVTD
jgi:hypothetical protein